MTDTPADEGTATPGTGHHRCAHESSRRLFCLRVMRACCCCWQSCTPSSPSFWSPMATARHPHGFGHGQEMMQNFPGD